MVAKIKRQSEHQTSISWHQRRAHGVRTRAIISSAGSKQTAASIAWRARGIAQAASGAQAHRVTRSIFGGKQLSTQHRARRAVAHGGSIMQTRIRQRGIGVT